MTIKLTKQGVRDLDAQYGRRKPVKAEDPPKAAFICRHVRIYLAESGDSFCMDCSMAWDWNGLPYND